MELELDSVVSVAVFAPGLDIGTSGRGIKTGIYSPTHGIKLKILEFEPKKHIMNYLGLGQNAVCTGR